MEPSLVNAFRVETVFDEILQNRLLSPMACSIKIENFQMLTKKDLVMVILHKNYPKKIRISIPEYLLVSFWGILIFMGHPVGDKSQFCRISSKTVYTLNT